jgi:tetratricopeptide (TPR) repeat protein
LSLLDEENLLASELYRHIDDMEKKRNNIDIPLSTWGDQAKLDNCLFLLNKEPIEPSERANLLYKIGLHNIAQGNFKDALDQLLQAKDLYIDNPPSQDRFHKHLPTLYDNIAMLYLYSKDYLKSLAMWKNAIDIRTGFAFK